MIRKNRVRYNNFTVLYFNKLNGEIYSGNRGTRSNFTVPYSEKNSFITASSRFFRFSSGVLWLSYISDCWTDPPDFTYTFEPAYSAADVAGDCTGADTDRLIQQGTGDRTLSRTAQQEHIISGPNIGMIRHVHHEHIHAHTADNRTDMTTNGFSPCFYSKAFLMSHSSQTVNLFCTLFFCLFRPDKSSRL